MSYPPPQGQPMGGPGGYPPQGGQPPQQRWQPGQGGPAQFSDVPAQPIADDPNAQPGAPPPMSGLPQLQGYGQLAAGQMAPLPPPPAPTGPSGDPPLMEFDKVAELSQEECRDAMINFVSENCCYGSTPAKEHEIKSIQASTALHYILESFCEKRETGYKNTPFCGQHIDGPQNGQAPPPWAIPCEPNGLFNTHKKHIKVPHTSIVKPCHHCGAKGYNRCYRCRGRGQVRCGACGGDGRTWDTDHEGHRYQRSCYSCGADGWRRCYTCGGDGRITCTTCDGYCSLEVYVEMVVTFINHSEDFISEETDMPDELVRKVSGTVAFEQTLPQVWPIAHYPIQKVAQASVNMTNSHRQKWPAERMLHQRQTLKAVPVTEVACKWDEWTSRYWVYGRERKVYCSDYPQTCCWGCEIL